MEQTGAFDESRGFSVAECREWLEADVLAGLQAVRELCMDAARAIAGEMKDEDADLVRLNAALVKSARAVRQTAVLQLEVAGLRRQVGSREPAANAAANANEPPPARKPPDPRLAGLGTYEYFVDDDTPRTEIGPMARETALSYRDTLKRMEEAMDADLTAAGKLLEKGQSIATKAQNYIRHIPHPATDACIQDLRLGFVTHVFGEANMEPPRLKTGPPDETPVWIEDGLSPETVAAMKRMRGIA